MLSTRGWIDGISATSSFIFAILLGLGIIYHGKRLKTKLLLYMGLNILLAGFFWFVPSLDFLSILSTGYNLPNPYYWMGIINFLWAPLVTLISMYIAAELIIPSKKKHVIIIFSILSITFEVIILLFPMHSFEFDNPIVSGESLIYIGLSIQNPFTLLLYFTFSISGICFCGFGYLLKGLRSSGVIKKKFFLLSLGYFLFLGFPLIRTFIWYTGILIPITYVRIGMVSSFFFFYIGLKEEPISKKREKKLKKEVKIEESLFRFYEKPSLITQDEVIFYKERKICLVCKSKVLRVSYICPNCNALYCINCAKELADLENMCWVCDEPFDESKPIRPSKKPKKVDFKKKSIFINHEKGV